MSLLKHPNKRVPALITILILILSTSSISSSTPLDGDNTLERSFRLTLQGDVVSSGVGLRGVGAGTINVTGIPSEAMVTRAFLYWATLGSANTFTSPDLNGVSVNGALIGRSADTCWGVQNNFVYRADVTSLVAGNGSYTISGLPDGPISSGSNDSQGASLVIVYSDAGEPRRTIIVNDGAVTLDLVQTEYTDTIDGFTTEQDPVLNANVTYIMGDGQTEFDTGNVTFNGVSLARNIFTGVDGDFWGTLTFDVSDLEPASPSTTTINNADPDNPDSPDCLLWAATVFSVTSQPADAFNELSTFTSLSLPGDVTSAGTGLRGTGNGTITVTGIPADGFVHRAFLYWATIGFNATYTSPTLNDQTVEGELIGASADTCWGANNNFVYRADVTPMVEGNRAYTVAGLPAGPLLEGNDDSQGASLVVIYAQPPQQTFRTLILDDGAVTLDFDTNSFTHNISGFDTSDPLIDAHITYIVGDGQEIWENGDVTFNEISIANNVFNGVDGNYWGTLTFDITGLSPMDPSTTTIRNLQPGEEETPDCLLWAATVFSVTPPQPVFDVQLYLPLVSQ